ncbi:MAG: hypothetical protein J2P39_12570, partial [Candidatus Dormibacteraeota bacterium]|nr:hypothetical protein [Candidatus Dormibacteraeota bacterium]
GPRSLSQRRAISSHVGAGPGSGSAGRARRPSRSSAGSVGEGRPPRVVETPRRDLLAHERQVVDVQVGTDRPRGARPVPEPRVQLLRPARLPVQLLGGVNVPASRSVKECVSASTISRMNVVNADHAPLQLSGTNCSVLIRSSSSAPWLGGP